MCDKRKRAHALQLAVRVTGYSHEEKQCKACNVKVALRTEQLHVQHHLCLRVVLQITLVYWRREATHVTDTICTRRQTVIASANQCNNNIWQCLCPKHSSIIYIYIAMFRSSTCCDSSSHTVSLTQFVSMNKIKFSFNVFT